jgi:hypothetical protein
MFLFKLNYDLQFVRYYRLYTENSDQILCSVASVACEKIPKTETYFIM